MNDPDPSPNLEQRLSTGRLPAAEALRIAALLAEQLRQLHDQGRAHGALTPAVIVAGSTVQLLPPATPPSLTPYTAPELLEGRPADARSDIFSFGAIFYEMLTGRRAFDGATQQTLAAALAAASPQPSGSPAVDRLVAACVAKSPDSRFQRVQKLQLELKLLMGRRSAPPAPAPTCATAPVVPPAPLAAPPAFLTPPPAPVHSAQPSYFAPPQPAYAFAPPPPAPAPAPDPTVRLQMQELESRMAHRLEEQERAVASVERVANEVLKALRNQPAPQPSYGRSSGPSYSDSYDSESSGRMTQALQALSDKVARIDLVLGTAVERIQKLEENLDAFDTDAAALRDSVTRDIRRFESVLKQQSTAIDSARTAMGQTDDLVERVVEALDSLQSMFINSSEDQNAAAS